MLARQSSNVGRRLAGDIQRYNMTIKVPENCTTPILLRKTDIPYGLFLSLYQNTINLVLY